jgi:hypothetical protein
MGERFPKTLCPGTWIEGLESEQNSRTYTRALASSFIAVVVVIVVVVLEVTLRIIYVIHSANIGAPCRKASA